MIFKIFLICLPAVLAEITINIANQVVQGFGESVDVISDAERETFQITDNQLKDAVEKLTQSRPVDVFVKSPTPQDLYQRYNWSEVRRTSKVKNASWIARRVDPQEIAIKEFHNDGSVPAKYIGHVLQSKNSTITQSSSKSGVTAQVTYKLNATGTSFTFNAISGKKEMTASAELGSQLSYNITLQPGQKASTALMADQCFMLVEVVYEASLSGSVATDHGRDKGLQFRASDINSVMDAGALPRTVVWREVFNVVYYDKESLVTVDANGQPL